MKAFPYALVYLVPLSVIVGLKLGGWFTLLAPVVVFGLIPLLDILIGLDTVNPTDEEEAALSEARSYRLLTWGCLPVQVALVLWGGHVVAHRVLSTGELIGFTLSVGISSGVLGINIAHELSHRVNERLEPLLSRIMLSTVLYMHWGLEHVVGHHRRVATTEDPATARIGESVYAFLPRTIFGGFVSAWEFEAARQKKKGRPLWHYRNKVVSTLAVEAALIVAMALAFGPVGLVYFLVQALVAVVLLEIINYIEHYGLVREKAEDGRYAPVQPRHSWNSSNRVTNLFLFNLQRHSDHHYKPGRRYQLLRHHDQSPQLPTGYAGMVLLAVVPPLWRSVMDERARQSVS